ncbi:thioesterase II family protein [Mucilaginibacter angelicae]|uniref:Thioesterase II family protein n=1 Tax=Mucilaginibacter angelicae TaxID=869718 RepID=A0ABV6LA83_9SPHI
MKKTKLFLLHYAGGSVYSFQKFRPYLDDFEVIPIELPGRGKRISEELISDFEKAAQDVFDQISRLLSPGGFLIYGHSMGAYLALKVCSMLEQINRSPAYLIVSGNPGPGGSIKKNRYLFNPPEFLNEIRNLGGASEDFLSNKELLDFFEPILRADFEVAERNEVELVPPVRSSLHAIMGNEEEFVDRIENWNRFTQSDFSYDILEGGHFFIDNHPEKVSAIIKSCGFKTKHNGHKLLEDVPVSKT